MDANGTEIWRKNYGNPNFLFLDYSELSRAPMLKDASGFYQPITVWDTVSDYYSVLLRFDFNGDTLWQKKFISSVPNEYFYIHSVCHSIDGGLILSGTVADMNNGTENALIIKTNLQGNVIWTKNLLSPITNPVAVWRINRSVQDSSTKRIVSVGWQYDSNWQATALLLITDSLGNPIFNTSLSGIYGGVFSDLIQTKDGNFIAVGSDGSPLVISGTRASWEYMVKFNINGGVIWQKKFSPADLYQYIWSINEMNNGDLVLGSNHNIPQDVSRISRTDPVGNLKWVRDFDLAVNQEIPRSINLGTGCSIFAVVELPTSPISPYILIKMDSAGCDSTPVYCANPVLVKELFDKTGFYFEIYPNPANDKVSFKVEGPTDKDFEVKISDLFGRTIEQFSISSGNSLDLSTLSLSEGLYLTRISIEDKLIETKKLIIAR